MSPIAFLGITAVIACVGLMVIWLRGRRRAEAEIKTSTDIDDDEGRQSCVT
jgi:hypothetical protein